MDQYAKFLKVKSWLSHQVPGQKNADVLEVLFDLYLNKKLGKPNLEKQTHVNHEPKVAQSFMPTTILKTEKQVGQTAQSFMATTSYKINKQEEITSAHTPPFPSTTSTAQTPTTIPFTNMRTTTVPAKVLPAVNTYKNNLGSNSKKSRYIPAKIKGQIFIRAKGKCENVNPNSGVECGSNYKLQIDHCKPLAHGGQNEIDNLRLLCSTCNAMAARNFGIGYETTSRFSFNRDL